MALMFERSDYTPAQLAKVLNEEFGHKATAAVIRKWDNEIFEGVSIEPEVRLRLEIIPRPKSISSMLSLY